MKKNGLMSGFLALLVFASTPALSQEDIQGGEGVRGPLAYFEGIFSFRLPDDFGNEMNSALQVAEAYPQIAGGIGAGFSYRLKRGIIIGGNGFGQFYPQVQGTRSNVELLGVGGQVHAGYVVWEKGQWFGYPSLGLGVFGYNVGIENLGPLVNQRDLLIPRNNSETLDASMIYLDLSVNLWKMVAPIGSNGVALGVVAGFRQSVLSRPFETSEGFNLESFSDPVLSNLYITLRFGGGGFK
jgi:hypothetical protein